MTRAIVFSRNRPAQLDLLLRSLKRHAADWIDEIVVLYHSTTADFEMGYALCRLGHESESISFVEEYDFAGQMLDIVTGENLDLVVPFCDDDVMFAPVPSTDVEPYDILRFDADLLCVSLRLGRNTTECYSLRRPQQFPGSLAWPYAAATGDFAYPGSLDGHVFRVDDFASLIDGGNWSNPNELEEHLAHACRLQADKWRMACYDHSILVGIPINSVTPTHGSNRHGEHHPVTTSELNERFLQGARLSLDTVDPKLVDAAHVEFPLRWEEAKEDGT